MRRDGKKMADRFAPSDEGFSEFVRLSMSVSGPERGDITLLRLKKKNLLSCTIWEAKQKKQDKKKFT